MRPLLNCWIVAIWLWVASRGRALIWMRRSLHFRGLIPHSGTIQHAGWRRLYLTEYIPFKAKLWTRDNLVLLFAGRYRVWEFRAVRCRSFRTMADVRKHLRGRT